MPLHKAETVRIQQFLALVYQRPGLNSFNYVNLFPWLRPVPGPFSVRVRIPMREKLM